MPAKEDFAPALALSNQIRQGEWAYALEVNTTAKTVGTGV